MPWASNLTEEEYRELQKLGEFDLKTSSWVVTRSYQKTRRALFRSPLRHYLRYHNGADLTMQGVPWRATDLNFAQTKVILCISFDHSCINQFVFSRRLLSIMQLFEISDFVGMITVERVEFNGKEKFAIKSSGCLKGSN
jgi:hypothetical protein